MSVWILRTVELLKPVAICSYIYKEKSASSVLHKADLVPWHPELVLIIGKLPWLGQRHVESAPLWCDLGCDLVMLGALRSFPARIHIHEP
jgi:hypothetical protein